VAVWTPFGAGLDGLLATGVGALALVAVSGQLLVRGALSPALPWLALALVPGAARAPQRPARRSALRPRGATWARRSRRPRSLCWRSRSSPAGRWSRSDRVDGLSYHLSSPPTTAGRRGSPISPRRPIDQTTFYPQNAELTFAFLDGLPSQRPAGRPLEALDRGGRLAPPGWRATYDASPPAAAVAGGARRDRARARQPRLLLLRRAAPVFTTVGGAALRRVRALARPRARSASPPARFRTRDRRRGRRQVHRATARRSARRAARRRRSPAPLGARRAGARSPPGASARRSRGGLVRAQRPARRQHRSIRRRSSGLPISTASTCAGAARPPGRCARSSTRWTCSATPCSGCRPTAGRA